MKKRLLATAMIMAALVVGGCDSNTATNNKDTKAPVTQTQTENGQKATGAQKEQAPKDATKMDFVKNVPTIEQVKNNAKDFLVIARDEATVSYVYRPSIKKEEKDGKTVINAIVYRDYIAGKELIRSNDDFYINMKDKSIELQVNEEKIYTYDGKFKEDGEKKGLMPVDKDSYGFHMGTNLMRILNEAK